MTEAIRPRRSAQPHHAWPCLPRVRAALLARQRAFRGAPGLVAEGRDMGTVVFPDATLKIYLTASAEARAERRYKQLIDKGNSVTIEGLLRDIRERDVRDSAPGGSAARTAADAIVLDTTDMTIDATIAFVLQQYQALSAARIDRRSGSVAGKQHSKRSRRQQAQHRGEQQGPSRRREQAGLSCTDGLINRPVATPVAADERTGNDHTWQPQRQLNNHPLPPRKTSLPCSRSLSHGRKCARAN